MRRVVGAMVAIVAVQVTLVGTAWGAGATGWTAYVTDNTVPGTVTPLATATGTKGTELAVGDSPDDVAITPDGRTAYVANFGSGTVTPIDTATDTPGLAIPVGGEPWGVAVIPDGSTVYVTNVANDSVTPIATATGAAETPIPVGSAPQELAITPDGSTVYVGNYLGDSVTPIDVATGTAGTPIPLAGHVSGLAITPDGRTLYASEIDQNAVVPITLATDTVGTSIQVGYDPLDLAITPDGSTVYVADNMSGAVTPITVATNTAQPAISVGGQPRSIAITPDGATAYVTTGTTVVPIDLATGQPGSSIGSGSLPFGIAITPDQPPTAAFRATAAVAGQATTFDGSASSSPVGSIATYAWSFGDGQSVTTTVPTVSHVYAAAGTYIAQLTVTNTAGTSLTQVFTGQTATRDGGPSARSTVTVTVPSGATTPAPTPPPVAVVPRLSRLRVTPSVARLAGRRVRGRCVALAARGPRPAMPCRRVVTQRVSFVLSDGAPVMVTLARAVGGRRVGDRCRAAERRWRHRPACVRWLSVAGRLRIASAVAGENHLVLHGRFGGRALAAGRYRLTVTPSGGTAEQAGFRLVG